MTLKDVIETFLNNFDYLNKKGKRKGFILFKDERLTKRIETVALGLTENLKSLTTAESKESDEDKIKAFYKFLEQSYQQVGAARINLADEHHYYCHHIQSGGRDPITSDYYYINPYKHSKFEKCLVKGMAAVNAKLDKENPSPKDNISLFSKSNNDQGKNIFSQLKDQLSALISTIKNHKTPDEIVTRHGPRSYAP